jgi:hypothetical protein
MGMKIKFFWQILTQSSTTSHSKFDLNALILKLVVCILLRVLGQVQGFRLTQHCFE